MPTKSDVLNYRARHFVDTAAHFTQVGGQWTASTETQHTEAMALVGEHWKGMAAGMYFLVSHADHVEVMAGAAQAHAAAAAATADGELVMAAQKAAQYSIEDAEIAGFEVSEDFNLTDTLPPLPGMQQARQAEAQLHAEQIGTSVNALVTADAQAAAKMQALGNFSTYHQPPNGHIMGTDFKTDKSHDNNIGDPPDHPHLVTPDPNGQTEHKHRSFGDNFESFTKVVGGIGGVFGGLALTGLSGAAEVGTDGVASPIAVPGVVGGLTAIGVGAGSVEKGLNELFEGGN